MRETRFDLDALFAAIDRRDWQAFGAALSDDVTFRYGSGSAVHGKAAVLAAADGALAAFSAVRHTLGSTWDGDTGVVVEGEVRYTLPDGREIALPFLNRFGLRDGLISEYFIFIDPSPIAAAFQSAPQARSTAAGLAGVARAPFLPLAALLALSGSAAQADGVPQLGRTALAVVGLTAAHILVNVLNELSDDTSGIDHHTVRTPFSGGSGALQAGLVSRGSARLLAAGSAAVALAVGGISLWLGAWALLPVLALGALCILTYSPHLLRRGLGELAAGLGLGGLPVLGAAILQGGTLRPAVWLVALAATCMTANLLLLNTLPDIEADAAGGRRSIVHRFGPQFVARLGLFNWLVAAAALAIGIVGGQLPTAALLALLPTVVFGAVYLGWLRRGPLLPAPMPVLGLNVVWNLGTHAALALVWMLRG
jgi:1,4-dihydroxy-2-naphthoate polyprenyltransferase